MSTASTAKVKIRKAEPRDVTALYRLLSEGEKNHRTVEPDEGRAYRHILELIVQGYVAVAEHSGRVVGSIGFAAYSPGYSFESIYDCEWFEVLPSYKATGIGLALLRNALRKGDELNAITRISTCSTLGDERAEQWFKALGFETAAVVHIRPKQKKNDGRRETNADTDADTGPVVQPSGRVSDQPRNDAVEPAVRSVSGESSSGADEQ